MSVAPAPPVPTPRLHPFASPQGVAREREGYALAAGLALGLITLGRGRSAAGLADLQLEERLRWVPCLDLT